LLTQVRPGDIAILHDPQTAGLTGALARAGVKVLWRCHIGIDDQNDISPCRLGFSAPLLVRGTRLRLHQAPVRPAVGPGRTTRW
jgi:trehalose synthase